MAADPVSVGEGARSRRSLLRAGLAGLAGVALGALGRPASARAAAGGPLVLGVANTAGIADTGLTTTSTGNAFNVTQTGTGNGIRAIAGTGISGTFTSTGGTAVSAVVGSNVKYAVYASNDAAARGSAGAIRAAGKLNDGLVATTANLNCYPVRAQHSAPDPGFGAGTAVIGLAAGATPADVPMGIFPAAGEFVGASGVTAVSLPGADGGVGLWAEAEGSWGVGVFGMASAQESPTFGVQGTTYSNEGTGVAGYSTSQTGDVYGVYGNCWSSSSVSAGVFGRAYGPSSNGVMGIADATGSHGVLGIARTATGSEVGVYGAAQAASGVCYGVYGVSASPAGFGVYSNGRARVAGNLDVSGTLTKGGGSFKIDHPLDPDNKYLSHSFVESPDMKNVYDGVVTLDRAGQASIALPAWFEALNRDFRYQLTAMDRAASGLHVKSRIRDGSFTIAGGEPGQEVCWQVTGIRRDAWAEAHRIPVEEAKPASERGLYLHAVELGHPKAKGLDEATGALVRAPAAPTARRAAPAPRPKR